MSIQNHSVFREVAQHLSEMIHVLEKKYEAVGDDRRIVVRNVLEALAAFTSLYAAERHFPPGEADEIGDRLSVALATCLNEFLAPASRELDVTERPWRAGRTGTA